jgi:hypothetical protein
MTGIGVAIYAQKNSDVVSAIAVGVKDFSARSREYFSDSTITVKRAFAASDKLSFGTSSDAYREGSANERVGF